jgi:light-harvesting complex 1 beta chain
MNEQLTSPIQMLLKDESKTFAGIFWAGFAVVLMVALVAQVLFLQWRPWFPGAESEKSMIGGVKSAVYTFMSHLS